VTDWGTSHQVKVFNAASGKEVRVVGKAGGPQVGDYDEQRMAHPLGMCVDSNGRSQRMARERLGDDQSKMFLPTRPECSW
jgi:hypothetical protein